MACFPFENVMCDRWRETKMSYLRTKMTMVVMIAAKNTKPPKAPNAIIAPKFNLAPCVSRCRSFSTKYGMFTFGDWSDLKYEQIEILEFHPLNIFSFEEEKSREKKSLFKSSTINFPKRLTWYWHCQQFHCPVDVPLGWYCAHYLWLVWFCRLWFGRLLFELEYAMEPPFLVCMWPKDLHAHFCLELSTEQSDDAE